MAQRLLDEAAMLLAAIVALLWLIQLVLAIRVVRAVPLLERLDPPAPKAWPRLTIVVPARDEGAGIEAALESKLACGYPALEIVAVDDRSRDDTGAILERIAERDARVRAVHVESLPEGWLGKLHAMQRGLELATGDWVLFSDADVHVEQGTLERLIAHAEAEGLDFVSVFPQMRPVNLAIDATVMALLRVLVLSGRVWSANDDRSHVGVGVGAFNLARRSILERTRAIEELRMEVADDVALGALLKQSGARCRFFAARSRVHLVFLSSISAAARSGEKGGGMLGFSLVRALLVVLVALSIDLVVPISAIAAGGLSAAFGIAALAFATATHALIALHFAGPIGGALSWPIGHLLNMALMLRSGIRAWRQQGVYWRDTFYSRSALESGRRLQVPSLRVDLKR